MARPPWPDPSWPAIGGYTAGVSLLLIWILVAPSNWLALVGGVFLVALGLFAPRLEEISAGKEGFKARLFQRQVVERITEKVSEDVVEKDPIAVEKGPEAVVGAVTAKSDTPRSVAEPPATKGWRVQRSWGRDSGADFVWRDSGTGQIAIVEMKNVANAETPNDFADQLLAYVRSAGSIGPRKRGLSPDRIELEKELFGAILTYQSDLFRSPDKQFGSYEDVVREEIGRFWTHPEGLDDEQVADLTSRVKKLLKRRLEGPPRD
jgi:hypothetical protein